MSTQEIADAERLLLEWLQEAGQPVSPRELIEREHPKGLSPLGIRTALWDLVDRGVARVTPDRRLEVTPAGL